MKKLQGILVLFLSVLSLQAHGYGKANSFEVVQVRVDASGKGYIKFASALTVSPPSCGNSNPRSLAFNTNTKGGAAIMALALTAQATEKKIWAIGTNTCSIYGTVESYSWGYMLD